MAVETQQMMAKTGRGHETRPSDRSGVGAGKLSGHTPQTSDFLGLLASLQSEDVDAKNMGQQDPSGLLNLLGTGHQLGAYPQADIPSAQVGLGAAVDPSLEPSFLGRSAWKVDSKVAPTVSNGALVADVLNPNVVQPNAANVGAEVSLSVSELGGDVLLERGGVVLGRDGGMSLLDESARKSSGNGMHGKIAAALPLSPNGSSRIHEPVVHWSRALGDQASTVSATDGLRAQLEQGRQSSSQVLSFKEVSAFPRTELATTVLFGGGEPRSFAKDEYAKVGREASFAGVAASESEGVDVGPDFKVMDPTETAAVEEDHARYWLGGEARHVAELTVEEMAGGPVEISIQLQGNEAMIAFKAEGLQARDALLSGSSDLEKLLGQEGMVLGGLSVGTSDAHGGGKSADDNASQRQDRLPTSAAVASQDGPAGGQPLVRRSQGVVDHFV